MNEWRPMGQTDEDAAVLVEHVPLWAAASVASWLREVLRPQIVGVSNFGGASWVGQFDRRMRLYDPIAPLFEQMDFRPFLDRLIQRDLDISFLDFLVYKLHELGGWAGGKSYSGSSLERMPEVLEHLFWESGVAWKVGTRGEFAGLERRVPEGVQVAAESVMNGSNHAGDILSEAWHAAFGVAPDASKAYGLAIKAVETAAKPEVSPKDDVATLGKMCGVLRDQKWGLSLARQDDDGLILREMVSALWTGQSGRHGSDGPLATPTQEQAETAVMLAVPLVHWFSSGAAARR
ncbi:hypothetical protein UQW22_17895 [Isoptericola halotolerans]|uniref:hypothetical protein n=1 Tax=Isoptericola halotolerans TaxID=300560 RepID=UPI00388FC7BC